MRREANQMILIASDRRLELIVCPLNSELICTHDQYRDI